MTIFERLIQNLRAELHFSTHTLFHQEDFKRWLESYFAFKAASDSHSKHSSGAHHQQHTAEWQDPVIAGYYANLELPYGADLDAVRKAWKKMILRYHPDKHAGDLEKQRLATELTKGLNHAYKELEKHLKKSFH
ncbi:heat shock protein DnaJ domain protein [Chloroherpeton thalassium ATCC 35110]|uniref:Heat shock protein DnaJ domain protein n=1 Tax=Chloroherpeton thalassium (strain ATCC 35110 / GB-78) TaxID=517418 RepID=B3QY73_CHLT3|nr:DnaJ domain-containing protein [Chloroherpeton thalassium]ACF15039.1 heat shock protein DnaJ domain protein [Chloroherpeton thalassium ATCC 35110]